ncbi:Aldo/keto reductase [Fistulina hepatica ATCC 64428]|uniref:Aldo/keto reductase n=1 Tax=Fistulina hepatica ATCC 64428 TaxID=1128425 RepID=A0A0D7A103_9AGAR|nr:Aldo/keto reductase [Fistulina hepatica ATCC 64428]
MPTVDHQEEEAPGVTSAFCTEPKLPPTSCSSPVLLRCGSRPSGQRLLFYTNLWALGDAAPKQKSLYLGNNAKSLKLSLENSLKRLRTSYIDILYVHYWDLHTGVEEIMDALHNVVVAGKVLYLGVSDTPAWLVVKANEYAKSHGKTPFVIYQTPYSVLQRDVEREALPMCHHEGRAMMCPWERTPEEKKVCNALEVVAKQVGAENITAVAIAYVMHKAPYVFAIIGGRKTEHLHANIQALDIVLSAEQISYIEGVRLFDKGFPQAVIGEYGALPWLLTNFAHLDKQPLLAPIVPK